MYLARKLRSRYPIWAFTLMELMVVMAIASLLTALALPSFNGMLVEAKISQSTSNLSQLAALCRVYAADNGQQYPISFDTNAPAQSWMQQLWPYAYPTRVFPSTYDMKGTVFYTPLVEKLATARTFGMNSSMEFNSPVGRRLGLHDYQSGIAYIADSKTSVQLTYPQINPRNRGKANVLFLDGHVESIHSNSIPAMTNLFWKGI